MEMLKNYYKELGTKEVFYTAQGFVIYSFLQNAVYIDDMYVPEEFRKEGVGLNLEAYVIEQAREKGFSKVVCAVDVNSKVSGESLKTILNVGYKLSHTNQNFIYLTKEI